jgi:hypothetical protein
MYLTTQIGFILTTLIFYYLLIREFKLALPRTTFSITQQSRFINVAVGILVIWVIVVSALSFAGIFGKFEWFPFNIAPFLAVPLVIIIVFTVSKTSREILLHIHPGRLIRLQVFRVFVEILLWMLFIQHLLPVQMTFEGLNFDILAGLTAPLIAYFSFRNKLSKTAVVLWNLASLALLVNIVAIAVLSLPSPIRYFMNEPSNTIVTQFPISWLPTFLVPLAYMLHFLSLRQALMKK